MVNKRRLIINSLSSVLSTTMAGLAYFIIYKIIINFLGVSKLGVWTIAMTTTSFINIANAGLQVGISRYVPIYLETGKAHLLGKLLASSLICLSVLYGIIALIIWLFFDRIYADIVDINALHTIYQILPYALITLFIMSISSVLSSFIDGYEKSYLKLIANSISLVVYIGGAYFFIKSYDLIGVAMAQLIQSIIYFFLLVLALKIVCPTITNISWRWDTTIFKEIISFSGQLQLISILVLLFEPITNLFIVKFAGLEVLGFYEMANRLISQIRNMLTQANQALIPVIAKVNEKSTSTVNQIYSRVLNIMMELSTYIFILTIILSYFISYIWIGYINKIFISSLIILCVGNYFNILSVPAYFSSMGKGKLRTILISHITMTVSNILLGYMLGYIYQENGIIIAKSTSLLIGSFYIIYIYHHHNKMSNYDLINANNFLLLSFICSVGLGFAIIYFINDWLAVTSVFLIIYSFLIIKYSSRDSSILNQLKNI